MSPSRGLVVEALLRRLVIFGATILSTVAGALALKAVLQLNGLTGLEKLLIALFVVNFAWIALSFWSGLAGFFVLLTRWRSPGLAWPDQAAADRPLSARTAVLMPVYNEDPTGTFANLQAIYESLERTGHLDAFDIFVLSDSTNPDAWIAEEIAWSALCRRVNGQGRIFYRKRRYNTARKAGNIEDFCRRWGRRYEFMVVLDADSLMTGETLVAMARLMEANPRAGIIQVPPAVVNGDTVFARVQQFASRLYGMVVAAGLAFWQLGDGNYWGHNAIIRTRAFLESCALPTLPGRLPFGGHILSHDFVEAALIRRAGWNVWMVPELGGSYEQSPPTVIDFAQRDRRWCQGNLQHLNILPARGLHPVSRVHLAMGIMSYVSSPLWLAFLVIGILTAVEANFTRPEYFMPYATLFPIWPTFDAPRARALFAVAMGMLLAPKLLGLMLLVVRRELARGFGGTLRAAWGVVVETLYSALLAPAMMLFQSQFVFSILLGRDSGWRSQRRGVDGGVPFGEAFRWHRGHTLFGVAMAVLAYGISTALLWWLSPVILGLLLAVPLSWLSARQRLGVWLHRRGLFVIPEETAPPPELTRANAITEELRQAPPSPDGEDGLARVISDPVVNAVHLALLPSHSDYARDDPAALEAARAKLAAFAPGEPLPKLTNAEKTAVLFNPELVSALHEAVLRGPFEPAAPGG